MVVMGVEALSLQPLRSSCTEKKIKKGKEKKTRLISLSLSPPLTTFQQSIQQFIIIVF
jgi:hypothetical protein